MMEQLDKLPIVFTLALYGIVLASCSLYFWFEKRHRRGF